MKRIALAVAVVALTAHAGLAQDKGKAAKDNQDAAKEKAEYKKDFPDSLRKQAKITRIRLEKLLTE